MRDREKFPAVRVPDSSGNWAKPHGTFAATSGCTPCTEPSREWRPYASGTARAVRRLFLVVANHSIHHREHRVHREVRNPGAIRDNSSRMASACKRNGASRPVSPYSADCHARTQRCHFHSKTPEQQFQDSSALSNARWMDPCLPFLLSGEITPPRQQTHRLTFFAS